MTLFSVIRPRFFPAMLGIALIVASACSPSRSNTDSDSAQADSSPASVSAHKAPNPSRRLRINSVGRLRETFNDSNHTHYAYARKLGIDPIYSLSAAYFTKRPVVRISHSRHIYIDSLTHSLPFLVPEAASLLTDIGSAFADSLRSRGADGYRLKVTSILRTPSSVKELQKVNRNATDSSTHLFGTTFDISYSKFKADSPSFEVEQEDLKNLLAEVLADMRRKGRCLVKFERHTACFHITVCD